MIVELFIRNFAIIEEIRIDFRSGFNVLTGETGAGKSIILDAMALVLGERADTTVIREGSDNSYVEALFHLDHAHGDRVQPILEQEGLEGDREHELMLSRELRSNGRSISRINGRTVSLALIRTLGDTLVDIHGQGEHLSLLRPKSHLPLLDAYASLETERDSFGAAAKALGKIRREIAALRRDEETTARRRDLLTYQVQEIAAAELTSGEDDELEAERIQLSNVEQLLLHGNEVLALLDGINSESAAATDLLGQAEMSLNILANLDESQRVLSDKLKDLNYQVNDLTADVARYCEQLEHSPARLDQVEERLEVIKMLKRKYGGAISAVFEREAQAQQELESIDNSDIRMRELLAEEEEMLRSMGEMGQRLSEKRQQAAVVLAAEVEQELSELNMLQARFGVVFSSNPVNDGVFTSEGRFSFDGTGIDELEFQVSTNPGEPLRPLARVASGGETSRLMLALKSVLARVDGTPTLIFDEIDQGIGGRVGDIVGRKLWHITTVAGHQVIIVTHLPQLAGYADGHFHVSKKPVGERTITNVEQLDTNGRVAELAAMLGTLGEHATGGAESILEHVHEVKATI